ncbi:MAG: GTP cyclohydrolase II RibA [Nitrospira sp.]|nr:GTP cyclohydrolase II RibA [Nitrospira sp.]
MESLPAALIRNQVPIVLANNNEAIFVTFNGLIDRAEHFAIRFGQPASTNALIRVHSECITGDVFGSSRCDCGAQLKEAIQLLTDNGGYILYMRQEGRGIGLYSKLDSYELQNIGLDTYEANLALSYPEDARDYMAAAQMIQAMNIKSIRLLTNNNLKIQALKDFGVHITEQIKTIAHYTPQNLRYMHAKIKKHGHTMPLSFPQDLKKEIK